MVIVVIIAVWFFTCYVLIAKKIESTQHIINSDSCFLESRDKTHKQCQALADDIHGLKKRLLCMCQQNLSQSQSLALLMDAARQSNFVLRDCTLGACKQKNKNIQQSVDCAFGATFDQLIAFFDYLYAQKIPVKCVQLDMQGGDLYEVRCSLRVYSLPTKESPSTLEKS